jgi:adenosylhomocysteine nucleosidase
MTTAILSALPEEQAGLLALLGNVQSSGRAGREFHYGTIHGKPVVLVYSRVGKVAAATTATTLIEHYGVERIVFTGVAGGLAPHVQVGDVVVGTQYLQHDMDASPLFARYEMPLYGRQRFDAQVELCATVCIAARALNHWARGQKPMKIHQGLIISGDRFVNSAQEVSQLRAALPDALCVEMEGAAVAQVCYDYAVPFTAVRAISDRADDVSHIDFTSFVRDVAGPYAVALVDTLMQQ